MRCKCLERLRLKEQLLTAGVDEPLEDIQAVAFHDPEKRVVEVLRLLRDQALVFLSGSDAATRFAIGRVAMIHALCGRRSAYATDLNSYIDSHFGQREDDTRIRARKARFLWLQLDFYRKHAWASQLFVSLVCSRASLSTLITEEQHFEATLPSHLNVRTVSGNGVKLRWQRKKKSLPTT